MTCVVIVDRSQTPEELLLATRRRQIIEPDVVAKMPRGEGVSVRVRVFKPNPSCYDKHGRLSDENLDGEFERLGLKPADFYSLSGVEDQNPVGTHWKDDQGNWCHGAFVDFDGERRVHVNVSIRGWNNHWKFAGIPK